MMSPTCTPMRNRIASASERPAFSVPVASCTATAHCTASTALAMSVLDGDSLSTRSLTYRLAQRVFEHRLMLRAMHSGLPVVRVGRGNTESFVPLHDPSFIGGSNLTAMKARLLMMACLMKFGSLPPAADPDHPTSAETAGVRKKVAKYQRVFDGH